MTANEIVFLDVKLLEDSNKLNEIDHWLSVLDWGTGWHYDLDIIWILKKIEELGLKPGATILDAGAGLGITQFILASRGYNVISLDFGEREIPERAQRIFNVEHTNKTLNDYHHSYMDFMVFTKEKQRKEKLFNKIFNIVTSPKQINYRLKRYKSKLQSRLDFNDEISKDHKSFGKIEFLRGTFNSIPLKDNSVDLLVSVSAFEHNKYPDMPSSVQEFERVVKPNGSLIVTTSAAGKPDHFHEPSQGWCFAPSKLSEMFHIDKVVGNYEQSKKVLSTSATFKKRIPLAYTVSGNNGLPYGDLSKIEYVPVGIIKTVVK